MIYEGSLLYIYVNNSNRIPKGIIKKAQIRNISSVTIIPLIPIFSKSSKKIIITN